MYTLHYWPDSASLIVRLVLEELALPHELRLIDRAAGALNSAAYRALNPLGQIPALETPDGPMFETAAILLYLCDRHGALVPAPGSPARAAFLKWLFYTSSNIHPVLLQLFYPERTAGPDHAGAVLAHARVRMAELLGVLEAMVARDHPTFLSDSAPTALGYYLAVLLRWMAADFPVQTYPALQRVLRYLETRPATTKAAAAEALGPTPFTQPN